jgi:hypothetical protein
VSIEITPRISLWKLGEATPRELLGNERAWLVEPTRRLRREIHARLEK